jgi:AAA domain-containing protein
MPTLDNHQSDRFTKLIYIGDSSTGKTGSLVSLVAAGYKFKILDMDNGLETLKIYARQSGLDLSGVEYETYRDEYRSTSAGPLIKGGAKAFTNALSKMTEWSEIEDEKTIFVLDSLSAYGRAAFEWAKGMNPTAKDPRQWFYQAQQAVESTVALLTGENFKMNVILISHVNYKEIIEGIMKGHVNAIGTALGPVIPRYFNTLLLAESIGAGKNVKRKIKTLPTGVIDLKIPSPQAEAEYPLETGLADIFKLLKG